GAATGWNPNADQYVNVIVPSGATVYVGGAFANIGGQTRFNLAELSVASGLPTSWDPHPDNPVNTIVPSGATLYVCGSFRSVGAVARGNIAAIDVTTGAATDWDPNVVGPSVNALMVIGANVYAGG